jgi:hypothetical protein
MISSTMSQTPFDDAPNRLVLMLVDLRRFCYCFRRAFRFQCPSFGRLLTDDRKVLARRGWLDGRKEQRRGGGNDRALPPTLARRQLVLVASLAVVASFTPVVSVGAATSIMLKVEASGGLPGFRSGELRRYLALHTEEIGLGDWRFEPAADDASTPNRVVWTFKLSPHAGGEVRSHGVPRMAERTFGVRRPITIEARLYLNGEYQTLVEGQATIQGGPNDPDLAAAVTSLTQNLLGVSGAYRSLDSGQRQGYPSR